MNDGGPAFACASFAPEGVRSEDCNGNDAQEGMSLRDYFAAKAMQALIAKFPLGMGAGTDMTGSGLPEEPERHAATLIAVTKGAYCYADAMLLAREM